MPNKRKGQQINQMQHVARDHVKGDFAGAENRGVYKDTKSTRQHSTSVRSRTLAKERAKTPVN